MKRHDACIIGQIFFWDPNFCPVLVVVDGRDHGQRVSVKIKFGDRIQSAADNGIGIHVKDRLHILRQFIQHEQFEIRRIIAPELRCIGFFQKFL